MKEVRVTNSKTGESFGPVRFKDESKANEFINNNVSKKSWGEPVDYEIIVDDVTHQSEQEEAEKEGRKIEIKQIKQAIGLIDSSGKPEWEKKLLKRLILELKE